MQFATRILPVAAFYSSSPANHAPRLTGVFFHDASADVRLTESNGVVLSTGLIRTTRTWLAESEVAGREGASEGYNSTVLRRHNSTRL